MHEQHRQRLRERFAKTGLEGFADHEVLELLLTYAIPRRDTNPTAHLLLNQFGSLAAVLRADVNELTVIDGIGPVAATLLRMLGELVRRLAMEEQTTSGGELYLRSPMEAARFLLNALQYERSESVYVLCLNKNHRVLHHQCLFTGTLTETAVYPRTLVEYALRHNAYALLLAHNHPSGSPLPSSEDATITTRANNALTAVDIRFPDHMIVGNKVVYSFAAGLVLCFGGEKPESLTPQEWVARRCAQTSSSASNVVASPRIPANTPFTVVRAAESNGILREDENLLYRWKE